MKPCKTGIGCERGCGLLMRRGGGDHALQILVSLGLPFDRGMTPGRKLSFLDPNISPFS